MKLNIIEHLINAGDGWQTKISKRHIYLSKSSEAERIDIVLTLNKDHGSHVVYKDYYINGSLHSDSGPVVDYSTSNPFSSDTFFKLGKTHLDK